MKKTLIIIAGLVLVSSGLYWGFNNKNQSAIKNDDTVLASPKNATYKIAGVPVVLVDGQSETETAPGSSFKVVTKYFGNEVTKDFDGDGRVDTAFLLTQNTGGSGTFYYVVVSLNKESGYVGSEGMFLGDRISPQSTSINDKGFIVVNYADRKPGESFVVPPSQGKSMWVKFNPSDMTLGEVVQDFEGEADVSKMTLTMKTWNWVRSEYNDGKVVTPKKADKFNLTFKSDKSFSASTDCNGVGGEYGIKGSSITFTKMMSTLMYCEGSQEAEFSKMLQDASSYHFTSKGELVLDLKFDSGVVIFR